MAATAQRFKLVFYAPPSALSKCKAAVFAAGAGRYPGPGEYTECAFESPGMGQFKPGGSANPAIGTAGGALEQVEELRCETICVDEKVARASVKALKEAHPYETPAYDVFRLEDF